MKAKITINNEKETTKLATFLAKEVFTGFLLLLGGELGAGKTRIAKAMGKELGITQTIKSPTFNILKCYNEGSLPFYHIDAYRLEEANQDLGFEEYIEGEGVCLIEWYEYISDILPRNNLKIDISIIDENKRLFEIESNGEEYDLVLERILKLWK